MKSSKVSQSKSSAKPKKTSKTGLAAKTSKPGLAAKSSKPVSPTDSLIDQIQKNPVLKKVSKSKIRKVVGGLAGGLAGSLGLMAGGTILYLTVRCKSIVNLLNDDADMQSKGAEELRTLIKHFPTLKTHIENAMLKLAGENYATKLAITRILNPV